MSERWVNIQKEIALIAKAKDCPEETIWSLGTGEYYNAIAVLEQIRIDSKLNQK